ncbi:MFS transporter [Halomonas sp. SpR8]|uniref:MFS transporter n=1 Tax=Halomonas sp. SpR8 TaxID=3050463 RepID=UPI0027E40AB4|nr:MFS transporter [Halomonas sp. SpR8]MDQ7730423.1 MFS transporter [Halomonas sp. SpR8]
MILKLSILSISLITVMAGAMIAPAVAKIGLAFPDATNFEINLLTSLHAGLVVPFSFVSGYLTKRFAKKSILIVSLIMYLVGGIGGFLSPSMEFMLVTRVILGIAIGLMIPLSITLISDYYEGEERTKTLGLQSAATNLGGIIAIVVSGILAMISWRYSFLAYAIAFLALFMVIFFLPKKTPQQAQGNGNEEASSFDGRVFLLTIYMILTFVVFYGIPSNMALFLSELDITNTVVNGVIIAVCSVGGFFGGMSVAFFRRLLKSFFVPLQVVYMAIGFSMIAFLNQYIAFLGLGVLILGFGYGSTVPVIFDSATKITSGTGRAMATALLVSSIYLGQFISPLTLGEISHWFGDGSVYFSYVVMALALVFVAILLIAERALHFTGIKKWLSRSSANHALIEVKKTNVELQERVDMLSQQIEDVQAQQVRDSREQLKILKKLDRYNAGGNYSSNSNN